MGESFDFDLVIGVFVNYKVLLLTFYLIVKVLVLGDELQLLRESPFVRIHKVLLVVASQDNL